jgi:chemotaxis protein methyltransferase CheR
VTWNSESIDFRFITKRQDPDISIRILPAVWRADFTLTITTKEFRQLSEYIRQNYGISLKEEKKALVIGRLQNILAKNNIGSFTEYYEHITTDKTGDALVALVDRITTNHTYFMRESQHFMFFREMVVPYLKNTVKSKDLRIWSAGCSTGEEPYTLAMILDEALSDERVLWDKKILATDISTRVLDKARSGIYTGSAVASVPAGWRTRYFKKYDDENVVVCDRIKNEVIFRKLNLMDQSFPFRKKFHVIFCRNVMIYFDVPTKRELINRFYDLTEYGGYLFIGHSESIGREDSRYRYVMPAVYRKV